MAAKETKSILLPLPDNWRTRLNNVVDQLNEKYPDANYSARSIAKTALLKRIEELESGLKQF